MVAILIQQVAPGAARPPHPSALKSPVAMTRRPAPSLDPCFFCNAPDHGHLVCPSHLRACQQDPTLASKCPACRAPGYCPVSCPRLQYFIRSTRFPYLEVDRPAADDSAARGSACRAERRLLRYALGSRRVCDTSGNLQPHSPGHASAGPEVAHPYACLGHHRLNPLPHRSYQPWAPAHGSVTGVNNHTLQVLGRVALEVRLGPLKTTAPFFVVPGVAFATLLGVDFLYQHEIAVSLARHALIFEGHGGQIFPLLGHHPRLAPLCALAHDVALRPGNTAWVRTTLPPPATAPTSPLVYLVAASTLPGVSLAIPEQLTSGLIALRSTSNRPLHLSAGWPLAKAARLHPAAIHTVRLVAADSAPPPTDGPADTPSYERVPGGFIPTLPSPNSCLLPA
ncbi:hypothetical protein Emag_007721 [Eimeria magna]